MLRTMVRHFNNITTTKNAGVEMIFRRTHQECRTETVQYVCAYCVSQ